jgi:tetratricopeptide (TPR) repeat protein
MRNLPLALLALSLTGCNFAPPPDPNDPKYASPKNLAPLLHTIIQEAADRLNERVVDGQITDKQRLDLLAQKAQELLSYGNPQNCQPRDAWIYADLLLTANRFQDAIPVLQKAVDYATKTGNDDRRVNDSLRLARALAQTGQIQQSLDLCQSVIESHPKDPGPILPAVLLQITPVAFGKGHDEQLAHVLEESIQEHLKVQVDPKSVAGKLFLIARKHHIRNAWIKVVELLEKSAHPKEAADAAQQANQMLRSLPDIYLSR